MLPGFQFNRSSTLWHVLHIVCMALVFSYICFDALDLDGSNFPVKRHPLERAAIVADVVKDTPRGYEFQRSEVWITLSTLSLALSDNSVRLHLTKVLTLSSFETVRIRGYRIALPRSSPADAFNSL